MEKGRGSWKEALKKGLDPHRAEGAVLDTSHQDCLF